MRVQKLIDIDASPKSIWPFFIETEKILQWCITFKKFEYSNDQRSGVGTPVYIEEQAGGPLMKLHFNITECRENEKLALHMVSGTGVKFYDQSWSLEPIQSGSRFMFMEDVELPMVSSEADWLHLRKEFCRNRGQDAGEAQVYG
jgi:hypothetical protein